MAIAPSPSSSAAVHRFAVLVVALVALSTLLSCSVFTGPSVVAHGMRTEEGEPGPMPSASALDESSAAIAAAATSKGKVLDTQAPTPHHNHQHMQQTPKGLAHNLSAPESKTGAHDDGSPSDSESPPSTPLTAIEHYALKALSVLVVAGRYAAQLTAVLATLVLGIAIPAYLLSADARDAVHDLFKYWHALTHLIRGGDYATIPHFQEDLHAKTHLQSLALMFFLWNQPHYRNGDFHHDMVKNLRNVAFPGTGIPLSVVSRSRPMLYLFVYALVPLMAIGYALVTVIAKASPPSNSQPSQKPSGTTTARVLLGFRENLLHPSQWFNFWRTNCVLASYHALLTRTEGYRLEDKLEFLLDGQSKGIAISPFLTMRGIVCKDRNEEGGMGIHVFKNATEGGQWIVQELIENSDEIMPWLPQSAPLSTLRIITASEHAYDIIPETSQQRQQVEGGLGPIDASHSASSSSTRDELPLDGKVKALSCVWRAGRADATTDHSSVLFDVDLKSGRIGEGTTNAHWYKLGVHTDTFRYRPSPSFSAHPDSGATLSGCTMPHIDAMRTLVCDAHARMLPDVPLCGWDVALTKDHGICLLEVNLSCNFFNGTFDKPAYYQFIDSFFTKLDPLRHTLQSQETS